MRLDTIISRSIKLASGALVTGVATSIVFGAAHASAEPLPALRSAAGVEIGWYPTHQACEQAAFDHDNNYLYYYPADGGWALMHRS